MIKNIAHSSNFQLFIMMLPAFCMHIKKKVGIVEQYEMGMFTLAHRLKLNL